MLGTIRLNLAEFVDGSDNGEEAVTRRYLMQESKINSTLKVNEKRRLLILAGVGLLSRQICLFMKQVEGDRNFTAPVLKTAPVFGGIAGIMTSEQGDADDGSSMPSMSSKAQESGKLQDLYRRNLAASFAAQFGELPADKCIEDIFNGGDGWGNLQFVAPTYCSTTGGVGDDSDGDRKTVRAHERHSSGATVKTPSSPRKTSVMSSVSGRASIEQQVQSSTDAKKHFSKKINDINEIEARDDLKSWEISSYG